MNFEVMLKNGHGLPFEIGFGLSVFLTSFPDALKSFENDIAKGFYIDKVECVFYDNKLTTINLQREAYINYFLGSNTSRKNVYLLDVIQCLNRNDILWELDSRHCLGHTLTIITKGNWKLGFDLMENSELLNVYM